MRVALCAALLCAASAQQAQQTVSSVVVLNNDNFEHLTQASTGSTTGDWFVKFFAPWCGHCKRMAPTWADLASSLHQQVNVAEVDCTVDKTICTRFGIRGFPTLLYIKNGKVANYKGRRDIESLQNFAESRGEGASWEDVPGEPGIVATALGKVEQLMMARYFHSDPMINAVVVGLGLGAALILLFVVCVSVCLPDDDGDDDDGAAGGPPPAKKPAEAKGAEGDGEASREGSGSAPGTPGAAGASVRRRVKASAD